eukprot:5046908-Amphidinium_carterae.1
MPEATGGQAELQEGIKKLLIDEAERNGVMNTAAGTLVSGTDRCCQWHPEAVQWQASGLAHRRV